VAFEVDATDEATRTGWRVVVRGTLGEVTDPEDLERLRALPLYPWAPGDKARYLLVGVTSAPGQQGVRRVRRHLLVAGVVLAYLAAGGVVLALGDRVALGAG
jgi:hypothetical protein